MLKGRRGVPEINFHKYWREKQEKNLNKINNRQSFRCKTSLVWFGATYSLSLGAKTTQTKLSIPLGFCSGHLGVTQRFVRVMDKKRVAAIQTCMNKTRTE